jgi:hypothetical protein
MSTVNFNLFRSAAHSLHQALRSGMFACIPKENRAALECGMTALRTQYNVKTLYILVRSYEVDGDYGPKSNSCHEGYFLSKDHAEQAGLELAFQRGCSFVPEGEPLNHGSVEELYVLSTDLF